MKCLKANSKNQKASKVSRITIKKIFRIECNKLNRRMRKYTGQIETM